MSTGPDRRVRGLEYGHLRAAAARGPVPGGYGATSHQAINRVRRRRPIVATTALAPVPFAPAYSISKAGVFSLTQSLRLLLARQGVSVHSVRTGPTDTEMTRGLDIPKASPESVARAIFDGIENGEEDIFPDPLSQAIADGWRAGVAKQFERQNAALVSTEAGTS